MSDINSEIPVDFENSFDAFGTRFPTLWSRFMAALDLAGPAEASLAEKTHVSRNFLVAQWGEDTEALRRTAYKLYALKSRIKYQVEEPVVVLRKGSLEDIFSCDDRLEHDVEIDCGVLASNGLVHGFQGNITNRGEGRKGVKPPFLGFGTILPVIQRKIIQVDVLGEGNVKTFDKKPESGMPVNVGTVPLQFSSEEYHGTKNIIERPVMVGAEVCASLFDALRHKSRDAELLS